MSANLGSVYQNQTGLLATTGGNTSTITLGGQFYDYQSHQGFNHPFVAPNIDDGEYQERLRQGLAQLQYGLTKQEHPMFKEVMSKVSGMGNMAEMFGSGSSGEPSDRRRAVQRCLAPPRARSMEDYRRPD